MINKAILNLPKWQVSYETTPLENSFSPAELKFKRTLRNNLPSTLVGKPSEDVSLRSRDEHFQLKYKNSFDRRHKANDLSELDIVNKV